MKLREWFWRLLGPFRHRRTGDMEHEMREHLGLEVEAGMRRGLTHEEAVRAANLRIGQVSQSMELARDQHGHPWLSGSMADLRHAVVALRRHTSFSIVALAALALSVAVSTLVFTLVEGVLLKPLPYREPGQLIRVFDSSPRNPLFPISTGVYEEYKRSSRTLESIALYTQSDLQLTHGERAERLSGVRVTGDFFPTLGVTPMLGRNFEESETRGVARVVILSHPLWASKFQSDVGIIGKTIRLNREAWTVVGVLPPGFQHVGGAYRSPLQGDTVAVWWPLDLAGSEAARFSWHFCNSVARLRSGVSMLQAKEDLDRMAREVAARYPARRGNFLAGVRPLAGEVIGGSRTTILLVAAASFVVLLVACINVAGLCVARGLARRRETAIRQALGAGTARIVRLVLAENVVLATAGGLLGLGLAAVAFPVLRVHLPEEFPRLHEIAITPLSAGFAMLIALVTGIGAGLIPAWRFSRNDAAGGLATESRTASASRTSLRMRSSLVVSEIALASVLCVAAVLLARSSFLVITRDHGFRADGVVTFSINLPGGNAGYRSPAQVQQLYDSLLRRLNSIPGVRAAGFGSALPWTGYDENTSFAIVGRSSEPGQSPSARFNFASPGFFNAIGTPVSQGRVIEARDHAEAPKVVVINESLARKYFAGVNPVGDTLDLWGAKREIVGVAGDVRDRPADSAAEPAVYMPLAQVPSPQMKAAVSVTGDVLSYVKSIERELHEVDPELPLAEVRTLREISENALSEQRLAAWVFGVFAAMAQALAAIGVYALLAYVAQQRRKEVAIRSALGASRASILWLVLGDGARLAGAGAFIGLLLSPLAARSLASLLFGVGAMDAVALIGGPAIILAASAAASLVPALTAVRVQPLTALRDE
jgi:macrolide transport system ATP-binding/permease protein